MPYFKEVCIFTGLLFFIVGLIIFLKGRERKINKIWFLVSLSIFFWSLGLGFMISASSVREALFYLKWFHYGLGAIFIPVLYLHFTLILLGKDRERKIILEICYILSFGFLVSNFLNLFATVESKPPFNYYTEPKPIYYLYTISFFIMIGYSLLLTIKEFKNTYGVRKQQIKYHALATMAGFSGGTTTFFYVFDIFIPPFGMYVVFLYNIIMSYAIIKYRLMDIKVAVTRAGIFVAVYSLVLWLPVTLGYKYHFWEQALWLMLVLATAGPSIYLYLQKKAEERILQEEIKIEKILNDLSSGMNDIKDLKKLLDLIVDVLVKGIRITNSAIYLLEIHDGNPRYILKSSNPKDETIPIVDAQSPLINELEKRELLVYEELKLDSDGGNSHKVNLEGVLSPMEVLQASVIIPIIMEDTMLGFLVLGARRDQEIYSQRVLNSLSKLANQVALAIENCRNWEEKIKQMEEEGQIERMDSLDFMASCMAHEIENPGHIIRQGIGFVEGWFLKDLRVSMPDELRVKLKDTLQRIQTASKRISEMITAILDYSRLGKGEFKPVRIDEAVESLLFLLEPKFKHDQIYFIKSVEPNLPLLMGNKIHIEEIIMNFMRNSIHAVSQRDHKEISLKVFLKDKDTIRFECKDNGYGISEEEIKKISLVWTTKKGSKESMGLGLYRVRKIVDLYKGRVWAESEGEGKGATLIVELPVPAKM